MTNILSKLQKKKSKHSQTASLNDKEPVVPQSKNLSAIKYFDNDTGMMSPGNMVRGWRASAARTLGLHYHSLTMLHSTCLVYHKGWT